MGPCPYLQGSCTIPLVWSCRIVTPQVKLSHVRAMPNQCQLYLNTYPGWNTAAPSQHFYCSQGNRKRISMSECVTDLSMPLWSLFTLGPVKARFANFQPQRPVEDISLRANPAVHCWDPRFCSVSLGISQASIAGNKVWHSIKARAVKTSMNA